MERFRKRLKMVTIFLEISLIFVFTPYSYAAPSPDVQDKGVDDVTTVRVQEAYGKLPLSFIQNDGQMDEMVRFYEKGSGPLCQYR